MRTDERWAEERYAEYLRAKRDHEQSQRVVTPLLLQEAVDPDEQSAAGIPRVADNLYEAAVFYSELGWRIIPVTADKVPAVKWSRYKAQEATLDELDHWFHRWGKVRGLAVINGAASAGLVCRDFDDMSSYQMWAKSQPDLAKTLPTVETKRGRHVYCISAGVTRTLKFGDGELRSASISVLPPSLHPSGCRYRWLIEPTQDNLLVLDDLEAVGLITQTERFSCRL